MRAHSEAVIVCVPTESVFVETEVPLPMFSSMSEDQARFAERSPSSASFAVPANATLSPWVMVVPPGGAVIVTTGATLVVTAYSTCNWGAPALLPSNDSAVRSPAHLMMTTTELPGDQPGRSTIS